MKRGVVYMAFMTLVLSVQAAVYTPASVPNPKDVSQANYVANPDRIIADSDVVFLNRCAARLERETGAEMAVVALEDIGDTEAFDFAYELYQRWGIGTKGKNTGVLVLFVLDSHDIRIMTGVGMEGVLPDAKCSQIIRNDMIPAFRKGDYGGGLCLGALRIYEVCTDGEAPDELRNMRSVTNRGRYASDEDELTDNEIIAILVVTGLVAFLLFAMAYLFTYIRCPRCGTRRARATREQVIKAATYAAAGQGVRTYCCKHCGYTFDKDFVIPRRQRTVYVSGGGGYRGGGGFSGGGSWGGGSTFGGGAGGKW